MPAASPDNDRLQSLIKDRDKVRSDLEKKVGSASSSIFSFITLFREVATYNQKELFVFCEWLYLSMILQRETMQELLKESILMKDMGLEKAALIEDIQRLSHEQDTESNSS